MSSEQASGDEAISKIILDIRALTLLYDSDDKLAPVLERSLLESQDRYVTRFLSLVQTKKSPERGNVPVAVGEIVLASFLTIIGLAAFVPVLAGLSTPEQWLSYFSTTIGSTLVSGPLYFGVSLLDFVFSALLLLGAFYSLRRAAKNLKNTSAILGPSGT